MSIKKHIKHEKRYEKSALRKTNAPTVSESNVNKKTLPADSTVILLIMDQLIPYGCMTHIMSYNKQYISERNVRMLCCYPQAVASSIKGERTCRIRSPFMVTCFLMNSAEAVRYD